jgi:hypothetical protein
MMKEGEYGAKYCVPTYVKEKTVETVPGMGGERDKG